MMHGVVALTLSVCALAPLDVRQDPTPRASDGKTHEVYAGVLDSRDSPVTGLTASDFIVREDGVSREVLKAGPATAPMQLRVIIDDSQASTNAIQPLREGLRTFVEKLHGRAEIGLVTVGERSTSLVEPTTDLDALKKGIGRIFARTGSGAYLLDGITDVCRSLQKRNATRPVIVVLTIEGIEYSNQHYEQVLKQLDASGATLHVLALGTPVASLTDEVRNRNLVLAEGTERTGGRRDQLLSDTAIPEKFKRLADELLNQYVVTYARPESLIPPEKLQVTVKQPGLTVRARTRVAGK